MKQPEPVICAVARTPIGKFLGGLSSMSAVDLGIVAVKAVIERSGVDVGMVDEVLFGQVLQAGAGQAPARQVALGAGLPDSIAATTINKVCGSGLKTVMLAATAIRAGEHRCIIAGGMESMSQAPHLLIGSRDGVKFGDWNLIDSMALDGLTCAFDQEAMGAATDRFNERYSLTREEQDEVAALSHQRAYGARTRLESEIVPVHVPVRKGDPISVECDEGIRGETTAESLSALRPAFNKKGTVTAGNASQISDGAAAVVVMSKRKATELGLAAMAEIGAHGNVAGPDASLHEQPARAILAACSRARLDPADIDLFEINEAFAAVSVVSGRILIAEGARADREHVNVNGGAIALGHPIGASGARLVLHLAYELRRRGGGIGAAALCGGGGQGDALLIGVR